MDIFLIVVIAILVIWFFSRKFNTKYDATQEVNAWFKSKGIVLSSHVQYAVYDDPVLVKNPGASVFVGIGDTQDDIPIGFIIEVIPGQGVVEDVILEPYGIATHHKLESRYAKMNGMTLMDRLQQFNDGNAAKLEERYESDLALYTSYWDNGQKKNEGNYKDGKKEGKWTGWHHDGSKNTEENYKKGKKDGFCFLYHENGEILFEDHYIDGKKQGVQRHYSENGQITLESTCKDDKEVGKLNFWYENGQKELEGNYKDGRKDGKWTDWHENGQIHEEQNWKDHEKDGKWTAWYENGQKWGEGNYSNGKKDGYDRRWYENGQIRCEENYLDGKKDGKWREWYQNGQLSREDNYMNAMKDGKSISWYENGQNEFEKNFQDGIEVKKEPVKSTTKRMPTYNGLEVKTLLRGPHSGRKFTVKADGTFNSIVPNNAVISQKTKKELELDRMTKIIEDQKKGRERKKRKKEREREKGE